MQLAPLEIATLLANDGGVLHDQGTCWHPGGLEHWPGYPDAAVRKLESLGLVLIMVQLGSVVTSAGQDYMRTLGIGPKYERFLAEVRKLREI